MNREHMKNYGYTVFICTLALAGLILLNGIMGMLGARYNPRLDLTGPGLYTLSEETAEAMEAMDHNVEIYILGAEAGWREDPYYHRILKVLDGYKAASRGRIMIEWLDPESTPGLGARFSGISELYRNDIIIKSPYRYTRLAATDLYGHEYNAGGTAVFPDRLRAEGPLTAAIGYVLEASVGKVCFLRNHGEANSRITPLKDRLESSGILCEALDLKEADIPGDAGFVVSMAPLEDYSQEDLAKMNAYLEEGGVFMLFYQPDGVFPPGLRGFLSEKGIPAGSLDAGGAGMERPLEAGNGYLFAAPSSLVDGQEESAEEGAPDNLDAIMAIFQEFLPASQPADIPAKPLFPPGLEAGAGQKWGILIVFVLVLPGLVLLPGIIIARKRKHL